MRTYLPTKNQNKLPLYGSSPRAADQCDGGFIWKISFWKSQVFCQYPENYWNCSYECLLLQSNYSFVFDV